MNISALVELVITQFTDQASISFISQLIRDISRVPLKFIKYFTSITILTSLELPAAGFFLLFLSWIWMAQNTLYYHLDNLCGTAINLLKFSQNYPFTLIDYTVTSQHAVFSIIYSGIIYFSDAISEWCVAVECYLLIFFACYCICLCLSNCYSFTSMYVLLQSQRVERCVPHASSFTWMHLVVLNLDGWSLVCMLL